jgi:alpha-glucoside transport system substrate-binding protein
LLLGAPGASGWQPPAGASVGVLGVWGGSELDSFRAMVRPFEARTGITVRYEGTRDMNAVLTTRLQGGHPPDVAALSGPGQIAALARAGFLVPLDDVVDLPRMTREYASAWLALGRYGGHLRSVFIKSALKGLVWYDPKVLRAGGDRVPATWDALRGLTRAIAARGTAPWCIGLESGAASGWPATDWIEIALLRQAGPDLYTRWYEHRIPWTDGAIRRAWQAFGAIATTPGDVYGGTAAVLAMNFAEAAFPLFTSPPRCVFHLQASFLQGFIQAQFPRARPGADYDFFVFPQMRPEYAGVVEAAGDLMAMFRDTPAARALVRYLVTPEAQAIWVRRGGALSPNRRVGLALYPDPIARRAAAIVLGARVARFDASDMMPLGLETAFYSATLDYVRAPGRLDALLSTLEGVAQEAYR